MSDYQEIERFILIIIHSDVSLAQKMEKICALLDASFDHYNWTGFYKADLKSKMLLLGPFKGAPTSHTKIPFGKGICGQVAESKKTFLVDDVSQQSNYISCSLSVKSENSSSNSKREYFCWSNRHRLSLSWSFWNKRPSFT